MSENHKALSTVVSVLSSLQDEVDLPLLLTNTFIS